MDCTSVEGRQLITKTKRQKVRKRWQKLRRESWSGGAQGSFLQGPLRWTPGPPKAGWVHVPSTRAKRRLGSWRTKKPLAGGSAAEESPPAPCPAWQTLFPRRLPDQPSERRHQLAWAPAAWRVSLIVTISRDIYRRLIWFKEKNVSEVILFHSDFIEVYICGRNGMSVIVPVGNFCTRTELCPTPPKHT